MQRKKNKGVNSISVFNNNHSFNGWTDDLIKNYVLVVYVDETCVYQ